MKRDAITEVLKRKCSARVRARLQLPYIVADAGEALEAALAIKEILHGGTAHLFLLDQVENDTGVDLTRTCAHGQPIERRKSHRAFDAAPAGKRAHGGTAAQMSNNDAPCGLGRDLRQAGGDIFIG